MQKKNLMMIITADTVNKIIELMNKDSEFENILHKYFSNIEWRNEFRQEMFLYLLEMNKPKLINCWNKGQFKWFYCGIVKNAVCSNTSDWYRKNRKWNIELLDESKDFFEIDEFLDFTTTEDEYSIRRNFIDSKVDLIYSVIQQQIDKNPHLIRDFNLFKMQFVQNITPKEIAEKTNIKLRNVYAYIANAKKIIIKEINKQKQLNN